MNDCSNSGVRDRLPDLLHDHLDASSRAMVVAHVAECVDCRDELALLESLQKTLIARTPRVDIAYVVGALPKAPAPRPQIQPMRHRWSDWRIAAAVTVLVAGGSSLVVLNRAPGTDPGRAPIMDTMASVPAAAPPSASPSISSNSAPANQGAATVAATDQSDAAADDGPDGRFGGLDADQMQTLLKEIDGLRAVPVSEPEPVTIRVDLKPNGSEGLR
jgi:hypothetical protein